MSTPSPLPAVFTAPDATEETKLPPKPLQDVPAHISALLSRLHAASLDQEKALEGKGPADFPGQTFDQVMADKFIALEEDKCHLIYQICRAINARTAVEVGTSYGVSTIYLALAVLANANKSGGNGRVIGTEHEEKKAQQAKSHWAECGEAVADVIELREGDLRETLKNLDDTSEIDFVLLDIWTPMALPALQLVLPKLRPGAVVIADNTAAAAKGYAEFLGYIRGLDSPFIASTLPFKGGLELCIYLPKN
ncbi:S-adenosyl-L-methionine-dependent methyltransferase [Thozetella sp. PMI_491]|nr:S-adenosyl-L-methionine-dependent methyltransferase [Thozetella sp. PMI_491]